jgi:lysophospholipase L1-like esterase
MSPRVRGVLFRASTFLLAGCLLVALLEGGARVWRRLSTGEWAPTRLATIHDQIAHFRLIYRLHPFLNTAPRAGASLDEFGERINLNSLGYRSPERPLRKPPGTLRLACAGGSTTFDYRADSDELTWPWQLEGLLRARGFPIEVWNVGFPGWTSLENLISLATRDLDLAPDVIVLFQGINDLQPASRQPFDREYDRGHAGLVRRAAGFDLQPVSLLDRSVLLESLRDRIFGERNPLQILERLRTIDLGTGTRRTVSPEALAAFARNLRSFAAIARDRGIPVVLVTQLARIRAGYEAADKTLMGIWIPGLAPDAVPAQVETMNDVVRSVARSEQLPLVDAARLSGWQDDDFADPWHFATSGSTRFAKLISEAVAPQLERARHAVASGPPAGAHPAAPAAH